MNSLTFPICGSANVLVPYRFSFYFKAGRAWLQLQQYERAEVSFSNALLQRPAVDCLLTDSSLPLDRRQELYSEIFEMCQDRLVCAWRLGDAELASSALAQAKQLAAPEPGQGLHTDSLAANDWAMPLQLATCILRHADEAIQQQPDNESSTADLVPMLDAAHELACYAQERFRHQQEQQQSSNQSQDRVRDESQKHINDEQIAAAGDAAATCQVTLTKALYYMAFCHLHGIKDGRKALNCLQLLRSFQPPPASHIRLLLDLLVMTAHIQVRQFSSAKACLRNILDCDDAPEEMCGAALLHYLQTAASVAPAEVDDGNLTAEEISAFIRQFQSRFPKGAPELTARLISALLVSSAAPDTGNGLGTDGSVAENTAFQLIASFKTMLARANVSGLRQELLHAAWDCATGHFTAQDFRRGAAGFEVCLLLMHESDPLRGKACRTLALCHLGLRETDK